MSDKDPYGRKEPPDEHEWPGIFRALEKAEKGWLVVGPIHALVTNWKAIVLIASGIVWINSPKIVGALSILLGGAP